MTVETVMFLAVGKGCNRWW